MPARTRTAGQAGPPTATTSAPVLECAGLSVSLHTKRRTADVLTGVDLTITAGQTLGLVGESGSGKTVTGLSVLGLLHPGFRVGSGVVRFRGRPLVAPGLPYPRRVRGAEIAMVPQDPMSSLDPAFTVGNQIVEVIRAHEDVGRKQAWHRAVDLLDAVGIPDARTRARHYPHEFSGGMRQRVLIAMAISSSPSLLVADEPTTALDVTSQAQILGLLARLTEQLNMATLIMTHDLGVVAECCDRLAVMYAGQIVEEGATGEVFGEPRHPYTARLMRCAAVEDGRAAFEAIPGVPPSPGAFPPGCRFHPRCDRVVAGRCDQQPIELTPIAPGRRARCLFAGEPEQTPTPRSSLPKGDES